MRRILRQEKEGLISTVKGVLSTDEKGYFTCSLPSFPLPTTPTKGTLQILLPFGKTGGVLKAEVDLSRSFPPGVTDLGDIRLVPPVFLAAGTVTDSSGRPLPGAGIQAYVKKFDHAGKTRSYLLPITDHPALADGKGRFQVYGEKTEEDIFLQAAKPGWIQEKKVLVSPGTRGVLLVMRKGGRIRATFRLGPTLSLADLRLALIFQETGGKKKRMEPNRVEENQAVWESLPNGKATLEVSLPTCPEPVLTIPGIEVTRGEESRDPRLKGIDLASKILVLDLELTDSRGKPIPSARILSADGLSDAGRYSPKSPTLLLRQDPPEYLIEAPGYKPKKIRAAKFHMKVVLEK